MLLRAKKLTELNSDNNNNNKITQHNNYIVKPQYSTGNCSMFILVDNTPCTGDKFGA